jgi:hypothetical protein
MGTAFFFSPVAIPYCRQWLSPEGSMPSHQWFHLLLPPVSMLVYRVGGVILAWLQVGGVLASITSLFGGFSMILGLPQ